MRRSEFKIKLRIGDKIYIREDGNYKEGIITRITKNQDNILSYQVNNKGCYSDKDIFLRVDKEL